MWDPSGATRTSWYRRFLGRGRSLLQVPDPRWPVRSGFHGSYSIPREERLGGVLDHDGAELHGLVRRPGFFRPSVPSKAHQQPSSRPEATAAIRTKPAPASAAAPHSEYPRNPDPYLQPDSFVHISQKASRVTVRGPREPWTFTSPSKRDRVDPSQGIENHDLHPARSDIGRVPMSQMIPVQSTPPGPYRWPQSTVRRR